MAADCFAHAVWGVVLDDDQARLRDRPSGDADARLIEQYAAPPGARLHYSGEPDDWPGRCQTDAGLWLLRYGLLDFPGANTPAGAFGGKADWHTWVSVG